MSQNIKVDDLRLPAAVVGRIIKDALPPNASVSKEARTAIARAAAVFILHLTTYATDYALSKKKKTLTAEDVFQATKVVECEQIEKPLKEAVDLWKVMKAQKLEEAKKRKAEKLAEKLNETSSDKDIETSNVEDDTESQSEGLAESSSLNDNPVKDIEDL